MFEAIAEVELMRERLEASREELTRLITLVQTVYGALVAMKRISFAIAEDLRRIEAAIAANPHDEGLKDERRARRVYDAFLTNDVLAQATAYWDTCDFIFARTTALAQLRMQFQERVAALHRRHLLDTGLPAFEESLVLGLGR